MKHLLRHILRLWPIGILIALEYALVVTNYRPGTYLMGWDNIMPEFNFRQAFITNIFGAWQEHRGVGLPDGMGHAANIVHTILIWCMSLTLPQHILRYAFQFLMHGLGMLGMYCLLRHILAKTKHAGESSILPLLGALFYGLNLVTIQMFYTPLEAFSIHYAALPWLAYTLTRYLERPDRNTFILFITASILTVSQFFIPTLILPTALLLIAVSLPHIRNWKQIIAAMGAFIAVNAFWMLPYIYALPHNAPIIQQAKINQMSSGEVYSRNRAFGDLMHVLTMQGFMLDFEDVNTQGVPIYVMDAWRTFTALPGIQMTSMFFAVLALLGLLQTLRFSRTHKGSGSYALLFIISTMFLATNTPGITHVMGYLRDHIPMFAEAYRFPFTKFGLLFGFSMSILIIQGIRYLTERHIRIFAVCVAMSGLFGMSLPVFQGQFFYDAMRVKLPTEYLQLFAFMDEQDHTGRTAYLPMPSYWSWKHYSFGYIGSGFLWYGLPQPLMDRAFDPWSNTNENYYWELSRALYAKDANGVMDVFRKYDIRYIILDENMWAPGHDRSLFVDDTKTLLSSMADIHPIGQTKTITVYELTANTNTFVRIHPTLPTVYPAYKWTDNDTAYRMVGDYTSINKYDENNENNTLAFPFRSLFTKRAIDEREFTIDEDSTTIMIKSNVLQDSSSSAIIRTSEPLYSARADGALTEQAIKPCGVLNQGDSKGETIREENHTALRLMSSIQRGCVQFAIPDLTHTDGYLVRVTSRHISGRPLMLSLISDTAKHVEVETLLETQDSSLSTSDAKWHTDYFVLPPLAEDGKGYSVYITNDAIGEEQTVNDIEDISFFAFPYNDLANEERGVITTPPEPQKPIGTMVTHAHPASYDVTIDSINDTNTLILSQAYNDSWKAYDISGLSPVKRLFPWVFGRLLTEHYTVNNWENGWQISEHTSDVQIIFFPQVFQFVGYVMLSMLLSIIILTTR